MFQENHQPDHVPVLEGVNKPLYESSRGTPITNSSPYVLRIVETRDVEGTKALFHVNLGDLGVDDR